MNGRRAVTAGVALSVAQFANVAFEDLIAGRWRSPRVCRHCGHPPDDFDDEDTVAAEPEPAPEFTDFDGGRANEVLDRPKVKKARRRARTRRVLRELARNEILAFVALAHSW